MCQFGLAQTTYQEVYSIFQANCTTGCHSGATPSANLDLGADEAQVYQNIVGVTPINPFAANTLKQKLIDPGYPERSYLLRKCSNGMDSEIDLVDVAEGNSMPSGLPAMEDYEIEMIRQWVIWGAQDTGTYVDPAIIEEYYTVGGIADIERPLTPEEEGLEGYQVRFGPTFLAPSSEFEYFQIHETQSTEKKEIVKMDGIMHPFSHHWVIRDFEKTQVGNFGMLPIDGTQVNAQAFVYQFATYMGIWMYSREMELPQGTAIFQDSASALLLNLHMPNYSADSVCKASTYLNVYTQDFGSGAIEMKADLKQYGDLDPWILHIAPDAQEHTFEHDYVIPNETLYFWNIQGHTHEIGTDFDVYNRNPDGTRGDQIYEGFYNPDYTFNQGSWDYTHPPVRTWDELLEVNMDWGLILEAKFVNPTSDTINFGFTTDEEMHIMYYQYTEELPFVSVEELAFEDSYLSVYPTPAQEVATIEIRGDDIFNHAEIAVFDMYGKLIFKSENIGGKNIRINRNGLSAGIYTFVLSQDNRKVSSGKLIFR